MKHKKKLIALAVFSAAFYYSAGVRLATAMIFLALPQELFKSLVALF